MNNVFQANSVYQVNGFIIKMKSDPIQEVVRVTTQHVATKSVIDDQSFSYLEPSDIAAAFAKYSMSVSWAVTNDYSEQQTSGM